MNRDGKLSTKLDITGTHQAASLSAHAFHVMTKPIGPICNLDCKYCFYLEKKNLFPVGEDFRMSDRVLEEYICQYIATQPMPEVSFAWQGGEPTLLGVDYFRKIVRLQQKYAGEKKITNAIQTNGTLLDDEWCSFLTENHFLVGLSIDGPCKLHDHYRVDKGQRPTFDKVMQGLDFLKKHNTEFNTLTVVNRANSQHPLEVYHFLKEVGSGFIQFIPLVERNPDQEAKIYGMEHAEPPVSGEEANLPVTGWSVESRRYGEFLVAIFDEWVRYDIGRVFVQLFDVALGNRMERGSSLCVFAERCGAGLAIEHNGDLFSCDHYVYPRYKLGNILNRTLGEMANSPKQRKFGNDKFDTLPRYCRECEVRFACNGECPKYRFIRTPDGEPGLNYFCAAYKRFFNHIDPFMKTMAELICSGRPAAFIMEILVEQERAIQWKTAGRNDSCPCGSGRKFKQCCLGKSNFSNQAV